MTEKRSFPAWVDVGTRAGEGWGQGMKPPLHVTAFEERDHVRILHSADWHLGQCLHGFDRSFEHQSFLDWLLERIGEEDADALLVAGDVFDTANPSAAAQRMLYRFLAQARQRYPHLAMVFTAGNHDSPGRLEAPGPLLEELGVAVVGHLARAGGGTIDLERMAVPLRSRAGEVVWCLAVPFLRQSDVTRVGAAGGEAGFFHAWWTGVAQVYQDMLAGLGERGAECVVALGHCHMLGASVSEGSERRVVAGGLEGFPLEIFDDARLSYVALGHLHLAQRVGGRNHVRYSGSPLPLSFSETHYPHQVVRVDVSAGTPAVVESIRIPRFVDLFRVSAEGIEPLLERLRAMEFAEVVESERHAMLEIRVRLTDPEPTLRSRIEEVLAGRPVRLARVEVLLGTQEARRDESPQDLGTLQPQDVFTRLYTERYAAPAVPDELMGAFLELMSLCSVGDPQ